jgi:hypothetical protein
MRESFSRPCYRPPSNPSIILVMQIAIVYCYCLSHSPDSIDEHSERWDLVVLSFEAIGSYSLPSSSSLHLLVSTTRRSTISISISRRLLLGGFGCVGAGNFTKASRHGWCVVFWYCGLDIGAELAKSIIRPSHDWRRAAQRPCVGWVLKAVYDWSWRWLIIKYYLLLGSYRRRSCSFSLSPVLYGSRC